MRERSRRLIVRLVRTDTIVEMNHPEGQVESLLHVVVITADERPVGR